MLLNARFLQENEIITNIDESNIAQVGIDLNLIKVEALRGIGVIPKEGKTILPDYIEIPPFEGHWVLEPGVYSITFAQGCKIPSDVTLFIRQRSSLLRNGAVLHSSIFDPGYQGNQMGTVIVLHRTLKIEHRARVAQIYGYKNLPVEEKDLYGGPKSQFQGNFQRK